MSRESWRKIEMIQNKFINYNLKIKGNILYHILLIKGGLSPIENRVYISNVSEKYLQHGIQEGS